MRGIKNIVFITFICLYANCFKWDGDEFDVINKNGTISNTRTLICEGCQLATYALKSYIDKKLSLYKNSDPPKGFMDTTVNHFLERHVVCSNSIWQPLADLSTIFTIEELIAFCRENINDIEEKLENLPIKKLDLNESLIYVCNNTYTCNDTNSNNIWKLEEIPLNRKNINDINLERSKMFLELNKAKPSVITTESGLQYKILFKNETSIKPKPNDSVIVNYMGKTLDNIEFDSSVKRNQPIEFSLQQVIKGWTEGLQLMSIGDIFLLYIPHDLAYGESGAGGLIGPNEALVFKLQLLDIKNKEEADNQSDEL